MACSAQMLQEIHTHKQFYDQVLINKTITKAHLVSLRENREKIWTNRRIIIFGQFDIIYTLDIFVYFTIIENTNQKKSCSFQ